MEHQMREMNFDARRAPLGKLTPAQIKAGYEALNEVSDCIDALAKLKQPVDTDSKGKTKGRVKRTSSKAGDERALREQLLQACNTFYTRIPHDFG